MAENNNKYEHKLGKGSILTNLRKQKEAQPDYNGELKLSRSYNQGDVIKFGAWTRQTAKGTMFTLTEDTYRFREQDQRASEYPREVNNVNDFEDDVPF